MLSFVLSLFVTKFEIFLLKKIQVAYPVWLDGQKMIFFFLPEICTTFVPLVYGFMVYSKLMQIEMAIKFQNIFLLKNYSLQSWQKRYIYLIKEITWALQFLLKFARKHHNDIVF